MLPNLVHDKKIEIFILMGILILKCLHARKFFCPDLKK